MNSTALKLEQALPMSPSGRSTVTPFLVKSKGGVRDIEQCLLQLDAAPEKRCSLDTLRVLFKDLAAGAAALHLSKTERLTHHAARFAATLQDGGHPVSGQVIDVFFRTAGCLRLLLINLERHGVEGRVETRDSLAEMRALSRPDALESSVLNSMALSLNQASADNMSILDEVLPEFIDESHGRLNQIDQQLVEFSQGHVARDTLDDIFRCFHTIKGVASFLRLKSLEALAHAAESLIQGLRDGRTPLRASHGTTVYHAIDVIRQMLSMLHRGGRDSDVVHTPIVNLLRVLANDAPEATASRPNLVAATTAASASPTRVDLAPNQREQRRHPPIQLSHLDGLEQITASLEAAYARGDEACIGRQLLALRQTVIELQQEPALNILKNAPRQARRLAQRMGKRVHLEFTGEETVLSRAHSVAMNDVLTHLIRNAVTHGIEAPMARLSSGKPAEGQVVVSVQSQGEEIVFRISDDGQGLDPEAIRERAIERGMVSISDAHQLSHQALSEFIFEAGFSTACRMGGLAGRGVGMDIVRSTVRQLKGRIELSSTPKVGTTFTIALPRSPA